MMAIKYKVELEDLKTQTTHLACESLMLINHLETSKAIDLCNKFLMPAARERKGKTNEFLCSLWEGQH